MSVTEVEAQPLSCRRQQVVLFSWKLGPIMLQRQVTLFYTHSKHFTISFVVIVATCQPQWSFGLSMLSVSDLPNESRVNREKIIHEERRFQMEFFF